MHPYDELRYLADRANLKAERSMTMSTEHGSERTRAVHVWRLGVFSSGAPKQRIPMLAAEMEAACLRRRAIDPVYRSADPVITNSTTANGGLRGSRITTLISAPSCAGYTNHISELMNTR
jgi:hypothetical protein